MSEQKNGGPAFPALKRLDSPSHEYMAETVGGMTLRDYFAANAMPTMISMCQHADGEWDAGTVAQNAYALADAMLAERAA